MDIDRLRRKPLLYSLTIGCKNWSEMFKILEEVKKIGYRPLKDESGRERIFSPSRKNGQWTAEIVKIKEVEEAYHEYKKRKGLLLIPGSKKDKEELIKWKRGRLLYHIANNEKSF